MKFTLNEIEKALKSKNKSYNQMLADVKVQANEIQNKLNSKLKMLEIIEPNDNRARATLEYDIKDLQADLLKIEPIIKELEEKVQFEKLRLEQAKERKRTYESKLQVEQVEQFIRELIENTIAKDEKYNTYEVIFKSLKYSNAINQIIDILDQENLYCDNLVKVILNVIKEYELKYKEEIKDEKKARELNNRKWRKRAITSVWASATIHGILNWANRPKGKGW